MNGSANLSSPHARPWWHFFVLAFTLSWLAWLPGFLLASGVFDSSRLFSHVSEIGKWIGGLGPTVAAILIVARDSGWRGVKALLGRVGRVRLGCWYLPTFFLIPAVVIVAQLLNVVFGGTFPSTGLLSNPVMIPALFGVFLVMQASEEFGWRGYAQLQLQETRGALISSLVVGVLWALWHIPMFLIEGFGLNNSHVPFGQFAVTLVCVSVLIAWIQNNTGNSLVPAFVMHALINLTGEALPLQGTDEGGYSQGAWTIANVLLIICTVLVLRVWGTRTMTRCRRNGGSDL